ncbi:hypothetical protein [Paraburkholderia fungorum]|uniref:hypothetical protein n=1 Tax=Paraburkholderia fungorum TaxID=134537 RepID=UPI0038B77B5A
MALLQVYDPPAWMADFDAIPGQRDAWHRFVLESFESSIQTENGKLKGIAGDDAYQTQFYSAHLVDPGATVEQSVVWNAFPKELLRRFGRARALIEADRLWPMSAYDLDWRYVPDVPAHTGAGSPGVRYPDTIFYRPTVEYCEWHVDRDWRSGAITRVTFTSEPPEYWFALYGGTMDGSAVDFPGNKDLLLELYRRLVSPEVKLEDLQVQAPLRSPFGHLRPGDYNPHNKWNTTHGIVHLSAPPNALTAEIGLGADATQRYCDAKGNPVVDPDALIAGAAIGGPNRNSDPTIAATVNALARQGAMVTLVNPVGLYMDHIDLTGWEVSGAIAPEACVKVVRGQARFIERLVVEVPGGEFDVSDIRIAGEPIVHGGQIAECITVKLVGAAAALGSVNNPSLPLSTVGLIDPANARELFSAGRSGVPAGTVPAFVYEAGELESRLDSTKAAGATRISRGMR